MTPDRHAALLEAMETITSRDELKGFYNGLREQGELSEMLAAIREFAKRKGFDESKPKKGKKR